MARRLDNPTPGVVIVDKPGGMTSHDVVARLRRFFGTRKVGHAGTLDPMATGVLVLGIGKATKILGHLSLTTKAYTATIRLGQQTTTDDMEGELVASKAANGITPTHIAQAMTMFVGEIQQVPAAVSAIKVDGVRAYAKVRAGHSVELAARPVTVSQFETCDIRRVGDFVDVDVSVRCSSGTYIRALARDLGEHLGVGGHLTALRRTAVGPFTVSRAVTLAELEAAPSLALTLSQAVSEVMPRRDVTDEQAVRLGHGGFLPAVGLTGVYAAFAANGEVIALLTESSGRPGYAVPLVVFTAIS